MNSYRHIILTISLTLYAILWIALHPYLGYLLDSDGVAYLTIAKRVASGQYAESINGLWSPLNSWMLVPFIQNGLDAWMIAMVLNCVLGACVLVLVHFLFVRFQLKKIAYTLLMFASVILMVHHVYFQMFGDVLQLIFVLLYLLVLWSKNFLNHYWEAALCGIIMGIGFYAKAYSLFFFLIHFGVTLFWFYKHEKVAVNSIVARYIIGCAVAILIILPWTFALHKKYNVWTLNGLAGKLNMSWYINSGKSFKKDISLLIPPTYNDSPSFWEDPYPSQENLSSPLSSPKHFVKWIARVIHTCLVWLQCFNEISYFALSIILLSIYIFFFKKKNLGNIQSSDFYIQLVIITILVLPLGYLMMHIETRYIWLSIFLLMVLGANLIDEYTRDLKHKWNKIVFGIFAFSFVAFSMLEFKTLMNKNKDLFEYAAVLNKNQIHGSFTSNGSDAGRMWVVAYLTHNSFYTIERDDYSLTELINEMKRYHVRYYVYQSENNKVNLQPDDSYFRFVLKADGFDLYELK